MSGQTATLAHLFEIDTSNDRRYIISASRPQRRKRIEIYTIPLRDRLPRCKIPLQPEDDDAVLDLPTVLTRCYDGGGYDLLLDYSKAPPVSLSKAEEEWMAALLCEKGLQTAPAEQ